MIFRGSGNTEVFDIIHITAKSYKQRSKGRKHYKPLVECYKAVGLVYQGTGSMEPIDFLTDAVVTSPIQWCPNRWAAGKALVMIEASERAFQVSL